MNKVTAVIASPYALCSYAILCWAGNFVVARLANLDVPPVSLSFWRHILAALMVLPMVIPVLRTDWPVIKQYPGTFAVLSFLFVAGNTLVYFCVLYTTVINAALINAGVPVVAVFFSWLILRDTVNRWQSLGIILSIAGITIVVTGGELAALGALDVHIGDLFMLLAIICWALYMVLLKRAGLKVSPWTLLLVLCLAGAVWLVPAYALEIAGGATTRFTALMIASLVYVALFSTIIAWAFWNSGTLRIGPNRAASFMSLHPVFGSALAILILDEALRSYHIVGTIPVLIGVYLVSRVYNRVGAASAN